MSREFLVPVKLPADPVNPLEAATKQYVDAHSGGTGSVAGNTLVGSVQSVSDVGYGTGGTETLRIQTSFVARTGKQYVLRSFSNPRSDTATGYTTVRLRVDTAQGGVTGTLLQTGLKDHRAANRFEACQVDAPPYTHTGADGATLWAKLTMAGSGGTGTDGAATYGPTWLAVDQVEAPGGGGVSANIPTGCIQMYAGALPPVGWLLCDGAAIPGTYTDLIALVGANTPDLRGRFPVGVGTFAALRASDGVAEASRTPVHNHTIANVSHAGNTTSAGGSNQSRVSTLNGTETGTHNHGGATGNMAATGIPYFGVNFLIKT